MLYDSLRWGQIGQELVDPPKVKKRRKATKPSRSTYRRRLLKLADMLEADAKNTKGLKFDLEHVGIPSAFFETDFDETFGLPDFKPEVSCGTTGCAMGLAAISGEFKKAGLSFMMRDDNIVVTAINGHGVDYIFAAERVFGLKQIGASFLFNPDWYPQSKIKGAVGERFVAKRIRSLVAGTHKKNMHRYAVLNGEV